MAETQQVENPSAHQTDADTCVTSYGTYSKGTIVKFSDGSVKVCNGNNQWQTVPQQKKSGGKVKIGLKENFGDFGDRISK